MRGYGDLEAVIMDRLWTWGGSATVRDVFDSVLSDRTIAYTTVMTVMDNLYHKGALARERDGKAWRYHPTATREEYSARLMREALDTSPATDMVFAHFVENMTDEESQTLRAALRRLSRKRRA